jgi:hypothetical protein
LIDVVAGVLELGMEQREHVRLFAHVFMHFRQDEDFVTGNVILIETHEGQDA